MISIFFVRLKCVYFCNSFHLKCVMMSHPNVFDLFFFSVFFSLNCILEHSNIEQTESHIHTQTPIPKQKESRMSRCEDSKEKQKDLR